MTQLLDRLLIYLEENQKLNKERVIFNNTKIAVTKLGSSFLIVRIIFL